MDSSIDYPATRGFVIARHSWLTVSKVLGVTSVPPERISAAPARGFGPGWVPIDRSETRTSAERQRRHSPAPPNRNDRSEIDSRFGLGTSGVPLWATERPTAMTWRCACGRVA